MTIVLHGKRRGIIRIERKADGLEIKTGNIPRDAIIYAVDEKSSPVVLDKGFSGKVCGIIVTDAQGNVLCEGRSALYGGSNAAAKMRLPQKGNTEKQTHSKILDEILSRAKEVFSKPETSEKAEKKAEKSPLQNKNNPFSALYPNSTWRRQPHGRTYILKGIAEESGEKLEILALPANVFTEREYERAGFVKVAAADDGRVFRMKVRRLLQE